MTRAAQHEPMRITIADPELHRALVTLEGSADVSPSDSEDRIARIAWSRILEPGDGTAGTLISVLGAAPLLRLLACGSSVEDIGRAWQQARSDEEPLDKRTLFTALERWTPRLDRSATLTDVKRAAETTMRPLFPQDQEWPMQLDELGAHTPAMLWVRGNPDALQSHALSLVGARAATAYGTHVTAELAAGVCAAGAGIVSGAAYGIDAVAHRAALAAGAPTVAVLAGGADRAYPMGNTALIDRIAEEGVVCSEVVPGTAPTRWRFLQRNRLVAALGAATLVTEAGIRSGSLNTAGHAAQLGRALGAVPGPVTSAASAGCHRLIREYSASLVTSASDACELLGLDLAREDLGSESLGGARSNRVSERVGAQPGLAPSSGGQSDDRSDANDRIPAMHRRIIDALPLRGARNLGGVVQHAGVSLSDARSALAELVLLGVIERREANGGDEPKWAIRRTGREGAR